MKYFKDITDLIGNTPIVKISDSGLNAGSNLFIKLESFNPSGSIKDRMVKYVLDKSSEDIDASKGRIVENSSGNTGGSWSMISAIKGYDCLITIPDKMSQEKIDKMKAYGTSVVVCPTEVEAASDESYYCKAKALAKEANAFYPDQYNSQLNVEAHYNGTAKEIYEQVGDELDYIICGIGTGGTISGIGRYFKEKSPHTKIIAVDPVGSVFYDHFKGKKAPTPKSYKVEGIGEDYLVAAIDFDVIDDVIQITDEESFYFARMLARKAGLLLGGSTGACLSGLEKLSKKIELEGKNILVISPDAGNQYLSKFFNDEWMYENGFNK